MMKMMEILLASTSSRAALILRHRTRNLAGGGGNSPPVPITTTTSSFCTNRRRVEGDEEELMKKKMDEGSTPPQAGEVVKRGTEGTDVMARQEGQARRRYERDIPPQEEERHKYWKTRPDRSVNKSLIRVDLFQNLDDKSKESFLAALEVFGQTDVHSRGHVEFIYAALSQMKHFQVHRDLEAYKRILDVFPKGRMISSNMFQVEFMHYPKQQQCAIDVLEQMEDLGVMPDTEVQQQLTNVFGSQSFPMRKASRMLYWMPKFKNLSPWPIPEPLTDNSLELARLAIQRITSVDLTTQIDTYHTVDLSDSYDETWVVSGQSVEQQKLIESHPSDQPIYVEGAFRVWIQRNCINYFILRAEPRPQLNPDPKADPDDVSNLSTPFEESFTSKAVAGLASVHEQDDGVILGICATGTSSRDSLVSWIRFLEERNPRLGTDISVLFTLKSPIGPTDDLEILPYEGAEKLEALGQNSGGFSIGSGGELGLDPGLPNLKQMGIWGESESAFRNWPHDHHKRGSRSLQNLEQNQKYMEEAERRGGKKEMERLEPSDSKAPPRIQ